MPFLLMFWKPIAAIVAVLALVATVAILKHSYDEHRRDEGRSEVQVKWDAANAAQKQREILAAKEADEYANRLEAKRKLDFDRLAKRTAQLEARLAAQSVAPDITGSVRDTIRAANATGTGEPAKAGPSATGTAGAAGAAVDGLTFVKWFDQVGEQYRACRERVEGWVKWDNERVPQ
jgi:hypothetical protein